MSERHDWSTTAPFLNRRWRLGRLEREILVIAWFTILRVDGEGLGGWGVHTLHHTLSGVLGLVMVEWQLWAAYK